LKGERKSRFDVKNWIICQEISKMLNFKKSSQISKSQVTTSHQLQSNQLQLWEEISDTPAERVHGGSSKVQQKDWIDPFGGWFGGWFGGF
jgi:hypothetical protein